MTKIALLLVIASAVLHAIWNVLSKSRHPTSSFFMLTSLLGGLAFSPVIFANLSFIAMIPSFVWLMLLLATFSMTLYYSSLAASYRSGDMSVAYPVTRASSIIFVLLINLALGRKEQISNTCILGVILVVLGCFMVPMKRFSDFKISDYLTPTCGLALLAAVGSTGYTIFDDTALSVLRKSWESLGTNQTTLFYACLEGLLVAVWLGVFIALRKNKRKNYKQEIKLNFRHALVATFAIWVSYILILVSMAYVENITYLAAFRQLSIPIGSAIGIGLLKEPAHTPKLIGVVIVTLGLILVGIG